MTIYEKMATAGKITGKQIETSGTAPHRTFTLFYHYENGLIVSYDGTERGFQLVKAGDNNV